MLGEGIVKEFGTDIYTLLDLKQITNKELGTFLVAQTVKNLPAMQETWVWSLSQEDRLEKGMATHSVFLPGGFHGQRSLAGYSPWGSKESDTTKWLTLSLSTRNYCIEQGTLLSVTWQPGWEGSFGREWIHVYVWLSPSAAHLKLSQHS